MLLTSHAEGKSSLEKVFVSLLLFLVYLQVNCNIFWPNSGAWTGESIFIVYSFIISFAVPLTLIMIFYVLVILKLRTLGPKRRPPLPASSSALGASNNALNSDQKNTSTDPAAAAATNHLTPQQVSRAKDRRRSHRKVTKLVLTVITVYFLCWAPYWATQVFSLETFLFSRIIFTNLNANSTYLLFKIIVST